MATEQLASLVARLEVVTKKLERSAGGSSGAGPAGDAEDSAAVSGYDDFIQTSFPQLVAATEKTGLVAAKEGVELLRKMADEQRKLISFASKFAAPEQTDFADILQPIMAIASEVEKLKNKVANPKNKFSRYEEFFLLAMYESVSAFSWVQISPAPVPYIQALIEATAFHTNKILKEKKDNGKEWNVAFKLMLDNLKAYVKEHHKTGLTWNIKASKGKVSDYKSSGGVPPPPPGGVPPPPPPGGIPPPAAAPSSAPKVDSRAALLASLNKGSDVTVGLKKVTRDMQTHKNPALRGAAPYKKPSDTGPKSVKPALATKPAAKKPPKLALEGKNWNVEYQENQRNLVIDNTEMKQTVYIYKCVNCVVHIKTKVNTIIVDSCKKVEVCFESVVSGIDFINSQSVKGQVTGKLATATIEKTDGCLIYLSKESLGCQIITAKSSEMNVSIPLENGEFAEYPIVEQFKTTWDAAQKKLITECNDIVA